MPARSPEQCDIQVSNAISSGNIEEAMALYEPDASFCAEPGHIVTGTDAIRKVMSDFISTNPKLTIEVPIVVQSGDTALLHSKWSMSGTGPDGNPVDMSGEGVEVVRRQSDGTWKFIIDNPWGVGG